MKKDHGGNIDEATARFGGSDWIDLSTGINPEPYPVPQLPAESWAILPKQSDMARLRKAAAQAYQTDAEITPFNGAQGAIQTLPSLWPQGTAKVVTPTYNEHAWSFQSAGWDVEEVAGLGGLAGADVGIVVTPNNPDGARYSTSELTGIASEVGCLVIDESFVDPEPEHSIAGALSDNMIVLRSFGKFYGLAGLRLGFAIARPPLAQALKTRAGPWPISGPAIDIAAQALMDRQWQKDTIVRLQKDTDRLDRLAKAAKWRLIGGTPLFRTYETPFAQIEQENLASQQIWSRIFPYSDRWIRLGLPPQADWARLEAALVTARA